MPATPDSPEGTEAVLALAADMASILESEPPAVRFLVLFGVFVNAVVAFSTLGWRRHARGASIDRFEELGIVRLIEDEPGPSPRAQLDAALQSFDDIAAVYGDTARALTGQCIALTAAQNPTSPRPDLVLSAFFAMLAPRWRSLLEACLGSIGTLEAGRLPPILRPDPDREDPVAAAHDIAGELARWIDAHVPSLLLPMRSRARALTLANSLLNLAAWYVGDIDQALAEIPRRGRVPAPILSLAPTLPRWQIPHVGDRAAIEDRPGEVAWAMGVAAVLCGRIVDRLAEESAATTSRVLRLLPRLLSPHGDGRIMRLVRQLWGAMRRHTGGETPTVFFFVDGDGIPFSPGTLGSMRLTYVSRLRPLLTLEQDQLAATDRFVLLAEAGIGASSRTIGEALSVIDALVEEIQRLAGRTFGDAWPRRTVDVVNRALVVLGREPHRGGSEEDAYWSRLPVQ